MNVIRRFWNYFSGEERCVHEGHDHTSEENHNDTCNDVDDGRLGFVLGSIVAVADDETNTCDHHEEHRDDQDDI